MKVVLHTLGCKLNQLETEALASSFRRQGFFIEDSMNPADIYVLNSCTVTSKSDQKGRKWLRQTLKKNPDALVIATGCYAQLEPEELSRIGKNVVVVGMEEKDRLLLFPGYLREHLEGLDQGKVDFECKREILRQFLEESRPAGKNQFRYFPLDYNFHTRAFLKIQDGCDYSCSYCRVPLARGKSVSLEADRVIERFSELESRGFREIVLTGVNINSYRDGDCDFVCLLEKLLDWKKAKLSKEGGKCRVRVRLSSLEPERIDDRLLSVLEDEFFCPHFHLSVQSGSDEILKRMRRRYNSRRVLEAASALRRIKSDPFLAADVIVGFPGEGEGDYRATYEIVERIGFSKLHVFPYSNRPGTAASLYRDHVPERVRDERVHELLRLSEKMHDQYVRRWMGKRVTLLVESKRNGIISGVTENYLKVKVRLGEREVSVERGELVDVVLFGREDKEREGTDRETPSSQRDTRISGRLIH